MLLLYSHETASKYSKHFESKKQTQWKLRAANVEMVYEAYFSSQRIVNDS